jgi:hypothetical protein
VFTRAMRWVYVVYAWIILASVIVQFFLAGLGVFAGARNFQIHAYVGYSLFFVMLIGLLLAFAARLPWWASGLMALLPVLVFVQSVLIQVGRNGLPAVAALHPVNGLAIFSLAGFLALPSRSYVTVRSLFTSRLACRRSDRAVIGGPRCARPLHTVLAGGPRRGGYDRAASRRVRHPARHCEPTCWAPRRSWRWGDFHPRVRKDLPGRT